MYATQRILSVKESTEKFEAIKIKSPKDAADFARQFYHDDIELYESFFLILLNRANTTIGWVKISQGGTASTVVDPIIVAKYVVDTLSSGVILVHNHPSGRLEASKEDTQITNTIREGLKLFNAHVIDHIILSKENYLSMSDSGII